MKLIVLSTILALLIFAFDLMVPLGVAGGVPYVALVLTGIWYPSLKHLYILGEVATVLVILGFFLSPPPPSGELWIVMTNRGLSLFGIWVTVFLIASWMNTQKELRDRRAELRHVSRLSDMGQMSTSIAHEINQPLTAIGIYIQAARRTLENKGVEGHDKVYENLEKAVSQADRASQIISRLRRFISKGETEPTPLNINTIIEESSDLALFDAEKNGIKVRIKLERNLPLVLGDKIQIQQVIVNLMRNSLDALMDVKLRELTISTSSDDKTIEVIVEDTGGGIPPEVFKNLFMPFNTTKVDGMGVGLSICRTIIEEHEGKLWSKTKPEGRTQFYFTLPVFSATPEV